MSNKFFIMHTLFFSIVVASVTAISLTIRPDYRRVTMAPTSVSFTCFANVALAGCQFRWWEAYYYNKTGPLLELSRGSQSRADPAHLDTDSLTGYSYSGRGLGAGDCGVTLKVKGDKTWMVACRVRAESGGWTYARAALFTWNWANLPYKLTTPSEVVVLPGGDTMFSLEAQEALDHCRFYAPSASVGLDFNQGPASPHSTSRFRYVGAGMQSGQCGLALTGVNEAYNGLVRAFIQSPSKNNLAFMVLVVARSPTAPTLSLTYTDTNVTATCEVQESRPVAKIFWVLGDYIIRQDEKDDTQAGPQDEWRWPWMQGSIQQTLTLQVQPQHNGKDLKCRVSHFTLAQPLEAKSTISLTDPTISVSPVTNTSTNLATEPSITTNITPAPPVSSTVCPPLTSETVLITCYLAGQKVRCSQPQQVGTQARLACNTGFVLPIDISHRSTTCLSSGMWNRPVFTCHSDCGRRNSNAGVSLSANGTDAKIGEFPWHIGVYETTPSTGSTIHMCGGTLIKLSVVVSAAHCFWDSTYNRQTDTSNYKVAAGKHLRAWDDPSPSVQKREVSDILLHDLFRGRNTGFSSDIALILVGTSFVITPSVNLVCMDWDSSQEWLQLYDGAVGVVAGWGITEDGIQSDSLKYVELPYVPPVFCLESLASNLQHLLTTEKLCAGFINKGTSVCGGDSGGGLVFRHRGTDKHYLRGIVSINFKPADVTAMCYSEHYTAFTKLSNYISWIQDEIE